MSFLEVVDIHKTFASDKGPVQALAGVNLSVEKGELVVIIGPSGCGKTTLLQIIAGLEKPTKGEVRIAGQRVNGWGRDRTMIFQDFSLFPWLTVKGNVEFGLKMAGVPSRERAKIVGGLIEKVGLTGFEDFYPHELSGGMQQRVAIARALAVDPAVLLMDEPFASVDALTRSGLQAELVRLWSECRKTILFVTHSLREALLLADRIVVLTERPGRVKAVFHVDVPRPREAYLEELAWWEARLMAELDSGGSSKSW